MLSSTTVGSWARQEQASLTLITPMSRSACSQAVSLLALTGYPWSWSPWSPPAPLCPSRAVIRPRSICGTTGEYVSASAYRLPLRVPMLFQLRPSQ